MTNDDSTFDELSARAERGALKPLEPPLVGEAAAEAGQADLMWATGAATAEEAARVALRGRPRLGPGRGRSPVVRARVADDEYAALGELARRTGRSKSQLVRDGVRLVLGGA
jgi:hypothetical protein